MRAFTKLFLSTVVVSALLGGCKGKDGDPGPAGTNGTNGSTGPQGPAGPSGQNLMGNLFGFVNPLDENGVVATKSGVTVTLDGVTPAAVATTDANGRFEFQAVRNGTYNLTYSRAGFGTVRRIGVGHTGGDQPTFLGTTTLGQPSTSVIGNFFFNSPQVGVSVPFSLTVFNPNPVVSLRAMIFIGAAATVNSSTGTSIGTYFASTNGTVNSSISKITLNSAGLISGTTAYAIAYGAPVISNAFTDPATGRLVYTSLSVSPSSVVSFIVP